MPSVTYIVSAYQRPRHLRGCLAALQVQTDPDFEVIVADNGASALNELVTRQMDDSRFIYVNTAAVATNTAWDSYWAAEWVVSNLAKGDWICLPSDDSYYMPTFQGVCLGRARLNNWSLVWPEMLYDARIHGKYAPIDARACVGGIDKTGFMIRKDAWIGFPSKNVDGGPRGSCCDGELIVQLVQQGIRHGKVEEILCVHS